MSTDISEMRPAARRRGFETTRWSVVLSAGQMRGHRSRDALARLCEAYWYPVYAHVRRRIGNVHEAQDLTQAFFCHLLEKRAIARADRSRGRFRTFLLAVLTSFLNNEWQKARALKRGQGKPDLSLDFDSGDSRYQAEPCHELTPERLYERRWVLTLLELVLERLRAELVRAGNAEHFEQLKGCLTAEAGAADYGRVAVRLGITPAAAKQAAYRLRKRYRELFREEVAQTVAAEADVDDEIRRLLAALAE